MDYEAFLARKSQLDSDSGFEPTFLPDQLFDFQKSLVTWALRKGRAALFEECGLGKSFQALVWAENVVRRTNRPVLILTPLAVVGQFIQEANKFGIEAHRADKINGPSIYITNYERLHHLDPKDFSGCVCDECFAAGTPIDCVDENGDIFTKCIETVTVGDHIVNASGVDIVADVHRREVPYAVRVSVSGRKIIASPNHPFFTQRGWVGSQDLEPGDAIMESSEAMRMVRGGNNSEHETGIQKEVLQSILLSEMAYEAARDTSKSTQSEGCSETRGETFGLVEIWHAERSCGDRTDSRTQSDDTTGCTGEGIPPIESHEPRTFRAWGQRSWFDSATEDFTGCTRTDLGTGIQFVSGSTASGLSNALQDRLSECRAASRHRSGWKLSLQPEASGSKERREDSFTRVDSIEVLEQGHPDLECLRSTDGKLYFYDLGATRHPSFSIGGLLVHNSSILKNIDGVTKTNVTEFMRILPYRLLATATPSPNDFIELGTSSEALGYLGAQDMLGRFFKNARNTSDTRGHYKGHAAPREYELPKWRFRGHAEEPFWRWVCSWARAMRRPSDLGFDDTRFVLPPLIEREHVVKSIKPREGYLFALPAHGLSEQREERKRTLKERCERAAELLNDTGQPGLSWCNTNAEGDLIERLIPDAVQVSGSDSDDAKEEKLAAFVSGQARVLVTKGIIAAWGLNLQMCSHMTCFADYSFEQLYQSVRRCWRYGQTRPVIVDHIVSDGQGDILASRQRKAAQTEKMMDVLVRHMRDGMHIDRSSHGKINVSMPSWLTQKETV